MGASEINVILSLVSVASSIIIEDCFNFILEDESKDVKYHKTCPESDAS